MSPLVAWLATTPSSEIIAATQYLESEEAKAPAPEPSAEEAQWAVLKDDDDYDPRSSAFIRPASAKEVWLEELRLLQLQIRRLQAGIRQRELDQHQLQHLGHYRQVLAAFLEDERRLRERASEFGVAAETAAEGGLPTETVASDCNAVLGMEPHRDGVSAAPHAPPSHRSETVSPQEDPPCEEEEQVDSLQLSNPQEPTSSDPQTPQVSGCAVLGRGAAGQKRRLSQRARSPATRRRRCAAAAGSDTAAGLAPLETPSKPARAARRAVAAVQGRRGLVNKMVAELLWKRVAGRRVRCRHCVLWLHGKFRRRTSSHLLHEKEALTTAVC